MSDIPEVAVKFSFRRLRLIFTAKSLRCAVRSALFRGLHRPRNALKAALNLASRRLIFPIRNKLVAGKPITVRAGGQVCSLVPDGNVAIDIWSRRHFERNELEFILNVLQPGMTFVDVGANVGLFSLPAARKVQHGKVFAFEPTRSTYELLARNVQINSLKNLRAFHSALGDYVGEAVLQVNVRGKDGLNTLGRPTHESSEVIGKETVPITTLDHFMDRHGIARVDAMKVDVEGAELFVFRGAENLLRRADAPLILYEGGFLSKGFDYHPVEQMWLLEKHGYCLFVIDSGSGQVSRPTARRAYNAMVIAVKPTHPRYEAVQERVR